MSLVDAREGTSEIYAEIGLRNEALVLFVSASTSVGSRYQKSNCALIFASRAAMIDAGVKYVEP